MVGTDEARPNDTAWILFLPIIPMLQLSSVKSHAPGLFDVMPMLYHILIIAVTSLMSTGTMSQTRMEMLHGTPISCKIVCARNLIAPEVTEALLTRQSGFL
jgi:hypothetical protein